MNSIREQLDKIAQKYQSGGQISKKYYIKTSLSGDGKSVPTFFDSNTNKQLEGQALQNAIAQEKNANLKNIQHHERLSKSPLTALDITGISNWGDAWRGIKDLYQMSTQKNVEFNKGDAALDALDIASAIPFLAQRAKYINLSKKPNMLGVLGVQLNHNLPKFGKFAGSNGLFDVASQTAEKARRGNEYQIGGNIRKEYLPDIQETVKFEKEYLNSPKFKERVIKAGYDYNDYRNKLKDSLNNLKINNINVPGKYSAFNVPGLPEIYIKNADRAGITDMKDIVAHEIGHEFDNSHMKDFINNNNVYDGGNMASRVYDKLNYFNPFAKNSNSHEADYKETVSDVHAVRKELFDASNGNYDGRYSNFNNDAYELMSEISANNPNSSSRRVFEKITNPKFKKIYEIMNKSSNEITPEEEKLIKSYGKEEVQFKKNIFNLMNRTVSNSKQYNYQDYS